MCSSHDVHLLTTAKRTNADSIPPVAGTWRRACPGAPDNARTNLVEQLIKDVTGRPDVCNLFLYGCWCGPRGRGKYLDNFD